MLKTFKYRIYPTESQEVLLSKHFGNCRMVYNLALAVKKMAYEGNKKQVSHFELCLQLTDLKREFTWLSDVNAQALQSSLKNLDSAFLQFFKGQSEFPKFKKKTSKQSFQCPQSVSINIDKCLIKLPKFSEGIRIVLHRIFNGKIKTVSISRTTTNQYYASVLIDTNEPTPSNNQADINSAVGIDLGLKDLIITSDGEVFTHPKYLKSAVAKLAYTQRVASRKENGSKRQKNANIRVAKLHQKIANQRKDYLHKVSSEITNRYDTICMESLQVANLLKNRKLSSAISDSGWTSFKDYIDYKCRWKGKNFLRIGTFEPSSKTCSKCGYVNSRLTLSDRKWTCSECSVCHDRDVNAAINIKAMAFKKSGQELPVERMELPTIVGAEKCEITSSQRRKT